MTIAADDITAGSGVLYKMTPPLQLTLRDLGLLTICVSDNTASNLCLRAVGGIEAVNERLHNQWNLPRTTVHRPIKFGLSKDDPPHTATGTPRDFLHLMRLLYDGEIYDRAVSDAVLKVLETTQDDSMIPRHLSVNPFASDLRIALPTFVVQHKTGAINGVRNDVGLVRTETDALVLAIFVKDSRDMRWTPENSAIRLVAETSALLALNLLSGDPVGEI